MSHVYERTLVPLRDGVSLAAALFRVEGDPRPTLLLRTPYGIDSTQGFLIPDTVALLNAGYNLAWVGVRGTSGSEGTLSGVEQEVDDGYDTVEWVIRQPWSDGTVGTYGSSYVGVTQWAVAASRHPAVKALAPAVSSMNWYRAPLYYPGGALTLSVAAGWHLLIRFNEELAAVTAGTGDPHKLAALGAELQSGVRTFDYTPVVTHPVQFDDHRLQKVLNNPDFNHTWKGSDFTGAIPDLTAPALIITGWFDLFMHETLRNFEQITKEATSTAVREGSRVVIGPWAHIIGESNFPAVGFGTGTTGPAAAAELTAEHLRHFGQWLPIAEPAPQSPAPVRIFVMGTNQWRDEQSWPLHDTQYTDFHFESAGNRGGRLVAGDPGNQRGACDYHYDPRDPVPTFGGAHLFIPRQDGPVDQRPLSHRQDILTFVTDPLQDAVEVTGYVKARIFVSSDAKDTDFTAKLVDVHPDGTALSVCDGIIRARYRDGLESPTPMLPGEVYEVEIDMAATSMVFGEGHSIRIDISSSNFPRFDRNTNTGGFISGESIEDSVVAHNVVYSGSNHPSRVILPVISRPQ